MPPIGVYASAASPPGSISQHPAFRVIIIYGGKMGNHRNFVRTPCLYVLMIIIFMVVFPSNIGATEMMAPKKCSPPKWLSAKLPKIGECKGVDFTGDGELDFIVICLPEKKQDENGSYILGEEYWVTSSRKILLHRTAYPSDHNYLWFKNLDEDPVPEIISAWGFSEDIDYTIKKIDLNAGKIEVLFWFEPVIIEASGNCYHGYPWDINNIECVEENNSVSLLVQIRPRMPNEGKGKFTDNQGMPDSQVKMPMVVFRGKSTQPDIAKLEKVKPVKMSLKEIASIISSKSK